MKCLFVTLTISVDRIWSESMRLAAVEPVLFVCMICAAAWLIWSAMSGANNFSANLAPMMTARISVSLRSVGTGKDHCLSVRV